MEKKEDVLKVFCRNCNSETNQKIRINFDEHGSVPMTYHPEETYWWHSKYQTIQCLGCDGYSFRVENYNSEETDIDGCILNETLYPAKSNDDKLPYKEGLYNVPHKVNNIYREMITCYNEDLLVLCAAGIRALVESICKAHKITKGTIIYEKDGLKINKVVTSLGGKINGLAEKGIISKNNAEALHEHKFMGDKAVHEFESPEKKELQLAIEIVETIIDSIYIVPRKVKKLKSKRNL